MMSKYVRLVKITMYYEIYVFVFRYIDIMNDEFVNNEIEILSKYDLTIHF